MADPKKGEAPTAAESGAESGDSTGLIATKKEFIQTFFKRAEEFTETLLRENERLRFQILELEEKVRGHGSLPPLDTQATSGALRDLLSRVEALEQEREQMLARFRSVQRENLD